MRQNILISPSTMNWNSFEHHQELLDFLWDALKLREKNEGRWQYLNFYTGMSSWELNGEHEGCIASVTVTTSEEEDEITEFKISLINETVREDEEISKLLQNLKESYNLTVSIIKKETVKKTV